MQIPTKEFGSGGMHWHTEFVEIGVKPLFDFFKRRPSKIPTAITADTGKSTGCILSSAARCSWPARLSEEGKRGGTLPGLLLMYRERCCLRCKKLDSTAQMSLAPDEALRRINCFDLTHNVVYYSYNEPHYGGAI